MYGECAERNSSYEDMAQRPAGLLARNLTGD